MRVGKASVVVAAVAAVGFALSACGAPPSHGHSPASANSSSSGSSDGSGRASKDVGTESAEGNVQAGTGDSGNQQAGTGNGGNQQAGTSAGR